MDLQALPTFGTQYKFLQPDRIHLGMQVFKGADQRLVLNNVRVALEKAMDLVYFFLLGSMHAVCPVGFVIVYLPIDAVHGERLGDVCPSFSGHGILIQTFPRLLSSGELLDHDKRSRNVYSR